MFRLLALFLLNSIYIYIFTATDSVSMNSLIDFFIISFLLHLYAEAGSVERTVTRACVSLHNVITVSTSTRFKLGLPSRHQLLLLHRFFRRLTSRNHRQKVSLILRQRIPQHHRKQKFSVLYFLSNLQTMDQGISLLLELFLACTDVSTPNAKLKKRLEMQPSFLRMYSHHHMPVTPVNGLKLSE